MTRGKPQEGNRKAIGNGNSNPGLRNAAPVWNTNLLLLVLRKRTEPE